MTTIVLAPPAEAVPDLSTRGTLLRYMRLRDAGLSIEVACVLSDAGYDVVGFAEVGA